MADISKITLPSGTAYDLKDAQARNDIKTLKGSVTGAMHYVGVSETAIADGTKTTGNAITISDNSYTAQAGDVAIYQNKEFIFSDTDSAWHEFGSTGSLKALAFKDSATGKATPAGSVSQPTFSGTKATINSSYTPAGTNSAPTVTVTTNSAIVNSITAVGTLPSLTTSVSGETLTISFNPGTLPTKGADTTVATGIKSATATAPTFTGTAGTATANYTPAGSVSKPAFTGTEATVTVQ